MKKVISTPDAVPPLPAFSQAMVSDGKVYASGSVGCDKDFKLTPGGIKPQTRAALQNLEKVLEAAGSGLEHIVKASCYLSNMQRDYVAMNEAYLEFFKEDPPARTCVGVVAIPLGADVEIECIAEIP
ncbi:YjgF-like protein [Neolentinus lepideus HHB14362 ss-1]|uniref:YjgF-like protein n=1 Tax=Neolentinus lepideus HHB14362 ss-1 TaxID=1314782 RepID=A0A165NU97_9AGAM|nr:YjgF-like protein [Neolentinus lepideus HHB14362 ss-1]